jgi:hypothetical protein
MVEASENTKICSCGATFTEAQSSGKHCFRCKVDTIGFSWRGPTRASRQDFHDNTIRGVLEEGNRNYAALGGDPKKDLVHTGSRWI